jgi:hypothetical protein
MSDESWGPARPDQGVIRLRHFHFYSAQVSLGEVRLFPRKIRASIRSLRTPEVKMLSGNHVRAKTIRRNGCAFFAHTNIASPSYGMQLGLVRFPNVAVRIRR